MFKRILLFIVLYFAIQILYAQTVASRVEGSPYPVSSTPSTIFVINNWGWGESKHLTTITLQGILAKTGSTMVYCESGVGYSIWLDDLVANYGVSVDKTYYNNFKGLITYFKDDFDGYILCDLKDNSSNVAVSLCSHYNAIAVTSDNEDLMKSLGKQMKIDVRGKDETWALSNYESSFSKDIVCLQDENKCMFLSDYSIFADAFQFFDNDINSKLVNDAFGRMNDNRIVMGWGPDEKNTVEKISKNSLQLNGSDWTENIPVLSNFVATTKQHTHTTTIIDDDNVHTVCFFVSDGDNLNWMLKEFYGFKEAYGSPNRGQVSIGWSISPVMCELAPTVMKYLYDQATNTSTVKDHFVGSTSGVGYMNPDLFPSLQASANLTNEYMGKADLNILNIIGTQYKAYHMQKYLKQDNIDAIFYYKYENYAGLNGAIHIVKDKPVIGARYRLWDGFDNATTLANKLNKQSTDAYSAAGYSLVAVHAWSFNRYVVNEINACASKLNSNVVVVSPDEFVKRINKKFGLPTAVENKITTEDLKVYPNPVSNNSINIQAEFKKGDIVEIVDLNNRLIYKKIMGSEQENSIKVLLNDTFINGLYILKIVSNGTISTNKIILQR